MHGWGTVVQAGRYRVWLDEQTETPDTYVIESREDDEAEGLGLIAEGDGELCVNLGDELKAQG